MPKPSVIVIGAGAAALSLIASLPEGCSVRLLTKASVRSGNSMLAQGGIAAVHLPQDSVASHIEDTLTAGDGHTDVAVVADLLAEGSAYVHRLAENGFPFDRDAQQQIRLGLEGAHSFNRIFHAGGDATGRILTEHLLASIPGDVSILEHTHVLKLIVEKGRCTGVIARHEGKLATFHADSVIIASGGCGSLYANHSGDAGITGDGLMLAYEAGAELCDLEFMQFHPTLLVKKGTTYGLISEAVRGEGGVLRDESGLAIMDGKHPLGDLAPRDIVARAIHEQIQSGHDVHLDIRDCANFTERFPTITGILNKAGIELEAQKIPVVPGMHFMMGGIKVDTHGCTAVPGLYAIGEAACTGLHGANRLASNSLLEALVLGQRAARHGFDHSLRNGAISREPDLSSDSVSNESSDPHDLLTCNSDAPGSTPTIGNLAWTVPHTTLPELQRQMSRHASIVRHAEGLKQLEHWLNDLPSEEVPLSDLTREQAELARLWQLARLVVASALLRTESRGAHYRADYPTRLDSQWSGRTVTHIRSTAPILHNERTTEACSVSR
ncbi:L-aspartate oxidase [Saccharibacillus sacchari]|uniref:L-aspartate oxidase n=1 Tax=Saccharibacillus sacchari TaxID=456493 RepID=A0ACC6PH28_9BACL